MKRTFWTAIHLQSMKSLNKHQCQPNVWLPHTIKCPSRKTAAVANKNGALSFHKQNFHKNL